MNRSSVTGAQACWFVWLRDLLAHFILVINPAAPSLRLLFPVQNADDNRYCQAAGLPVLELVTSSRAVTALNNERGFEQRDVEGICEVGGSKKQGKAGFTGGEALVVVRHSLLYCFYYTCHLAVSALYPMPRMLVIGCLAWLFEVCMQRQVRSHCPSTDRHAFN